MRSATLIRRHWVMVVGAWVAAGSVPALLLTSVGLGIGGVWQSEPLVAASGVLVAVAAALLERRRIWALDGRLIRMRTRLRVTRSKADAELTDLRRQVRDLDRQLWEYRLVDQLSPQAHSLISRMAATLAEPAMATPATESVPNDEDWEWFDTRPIELAAVAQAAGDAADEPASDNPADEPAADNPADEPAAGEPADEPAAEPSTAPAVTVIDLRGFPTQVDDSGPIDVAVLDDLVYRGLAAAVQDELTAVLEQPSSPRRGAPPPTPARGLATIPDDPGSRTA